MDFNKAYQNQISYSVHISKQTNVIMCKLICAYLQRIVVNSPKIGNSEHITFS
jgi:hypothetical protein